MLGEGIFYLCSILFIWVEIFQVKNKNKIQDINYQKSNPKIWILFYWLKIFYFTWVIAGLFGTNPLSCSIIFGTYILKYPISALKNKLIVVGYELISISIRIIVLLGFTFLGAVLLL